MQACMLCHTLVCEQMLRSTSSHQLMQARVLDLGTFFLLPSEEDACPCAFLTLRKKYFAGLMTNLPTFEYKGTFQVS